MARAWEYFNCALIKRTFEIKVPDSFLKSIYRDKLTDLLYHNGAYKVKRVGNSGHQKLYVSFMDDDRSDIILAEVVREAIKDYELLLAKK